MKLTSRIGFVLRAASGAIGIVGERLERVGESRDVKVTELIDRVGEELGLERESAEPDRHYFGRQLAEIESVRAQHNDQFASLRQIDERLDQMRIPRGPTAVRLSMIQNGIKRDRLFGLARAQIRSTEIDQLIRIVLDVDAERHDLEGLMAQLNGPISRLVETDREFEFDEQPDGPEDAIVMVRRGIDQILSGLDCTLFDVTPEVAGRIARWMGGKDDPTEWAFAETEGSDMELLYNKTQRSQLLRQQLDDPELRRLIGEAAIRRDERAEGYGRPVPTWQFSYVAGETPGTEYDFDRFIESAKRRRLTVEQVVDALEEMKREDLAPTEDGDEIQFDAVAAEPHVEARPDHPYSWEVEPKPDTPLRSSLKDSVLNDRWRQVPENAALLAHVETQIVKQVGCPAGLSNEVVSACRRRLDAGFARAKIVKRAVDIARAEWFEVVAKRASATSSWVEEAMLAKQDEIDEDEELIGGNSDHCVMLRQDIGDEEFGRRVRSAIERRRIRKVAAELAGRARPSPNGGPNVAPKRTSGSARSNVPRRSRPTASGSSSGIRTPR